MSKPKIIVWDIETSWGLNANTGAIFCLAYKYLGQKKTHCISQWDFKGWKRDIFDDEKVVKSAYSVLSEADAFITHYGSRFDLPYLNSRLLAHGLTILPTVPHVDTWRISRYKLKLHNNRLNTLAEFLGVGSKMHIGQKAWSNIMNRDVKSGKLMAKYCKQDVDILADVYDRVKTLDLVSPNYNLFVADDKVVCPHCGSFYIQYNGYRLTKTARYKRFKCNECGGWGSVNTKGKAPRKM